MKISFPKVDIIFILLIYSKEFLKILFNFYGANNQIKKEICYIFLSNLHFRIRRNRFFSINEFENKIKISAYFKKISRNKVLLKKKYFIIFND